MAASPLRWRSLGLLAAVLALAGAARLPYLKHPNLSPDAVDYLNIARNVARGDGLTLSIKWHFFTDDPAVHSAIGERPILYPLLLAPFCRGETPALPAQYVTVFLALLAAALAAAWARRLGLSWRAAILSGAILSFNPGLLMCSVFTWTEPLYLCWLFVILLVVGDDPHNPRRAWLAALLTVIAFLTRPTAPAIAAALCVWYARRRSFATLGHYAFALILFLLPWLAVVWAVRGSPFYSLQGFHLSVMEIRDGMQFGYGVKFQQPVEFVVSHMTPILLQIVRQTLTYFAQLIGPTFLSILSAFLLFHVFRRSGNETSERGPWLIIALFQFAMPALTWATFEAVRFMVPSFAVLVAPAVGELDRMIEQLSARRVRAALWVSLLIVIGLPYLDQWMQLHVRVEDKRQDDLTMQVGRIEFERTVEPHAVIAARDPFLTNYYFDRPAIMLPEARDPKATAALLSRFADEYRPDYFLLKHPNVQQVAPLVASGRLQLVGNIESLAVSVFRTAQPAREPIDAPTGSDGPTNRAPPNSPK